MTTRSANQSPVQTTMTAAPARSSHCGRGLAKPAARPRMLIHLLLPILLLGGCATGFAPGQSGRTHAVIGNDPSGPRTLLLQPVAGARLSSPFGERKDPLGGGGGRMHQGIDFAAPSGTPVRAAGDGVVTAVGPRGSYGHYVRIRHDATYETAYAHLSRYADDMARGVRVKQGEVIGYVGNTGRSTGPHLHYEILAHGTQVDPFEVGPSLAHTVKGGAVGAVRAVGSTFKSIGATVMATAGKVLGQPARLLMGDDRGRQN